MIFKAEICSKFCRTVKKSVDTQRRAHLLLSNNLLLILESDKDYNKTSQIMDIFPITLRLSRKVNFWG